MGRSIKIELSDNQRKDLENGYRNGKSYSFRTKCKIVLLKSKGRFSKEIADFLSSSEQKVNGWRGDIKRKAFRFGNPSGTRTTRHFTN